MSLRVIGVEKVAPPLVEVEKRMLDVVVVPCRVDVEVNLVQLT